MLLPGRDRDTRFAPTIVMRRAAGVLRRIHIMLGSLAACLSTHIYSIMSIWIKMFITYAKKHEKTTRETAKCAIHDIICEKTTRNSFESITGTLYLARGISTRS